MRNTRPLLAVAGLLGLIAAGCSQGTAPPSASTSGTLASAAESEQTKPASNENDGPRIPAYHATLESARPLPAPRPASRYKDFPIIERAYTVASEIPEVLALQPCYCYCDKSAGHGSLADCWASDHGAG